MKEHEPSDAETCIACDSFAGPAADDAADPDDRARLNDALVEGFACIAAGQFCLAAEVIAALKRSGAAPA